MKIGVSYGNPETTTGGNALKYYASVRLDIRRSEVLKNKDDVYGNRVKCKVVKNKVAPPFKVAEFDILYGKGISKFSEAVDMGVARGVIEKSGAWFYYEGTRLGQGKENAIAALENDPSLMEEISEKVKNAKAVEKPEDDLDKLEEEEDELDLNEINLDEE